MALFKIKKKKWANRKRQRFDSILWKPLNRSDTTDI